MMNYISYLNKAKSDIKKVVIVYPFTYINPYFALPPIAAEYLQAGFAEAGKNVVLLDMRFETDIEEQVKNADLVCLYGYFEDCSIFGKWKFHVITEVLKQIPPDTPVIAGGTGFTDTEEAMRTYPNIDIIIRGNPELPVIELMNTGTPENIRNLVYRDGDEIIYAERVTHILSEDIYPKRNLRNPKYFYHVTGFKVDLVRSAAGCNYKCKFCYEYGKDFDGKYMRWHGRSARSLFNELKEIEAPFVGWVDDDMTTDMATLEELSDLLIKEGITKFYMGTGRVDHVIKSNVAALRKMEKAGFLALSFGVESVKKETLRFYGKGLSIENIEKGMSMMQKTNIMLICNFIFGSPGETEEDMLNMLWFGRKWNADTIVTNRFRVQKDSPMHDLIYDHETGKAKPGMERIEGDELARIKYKIKFAQRTPFRIMLTILKLYRHKGMSIDPGILFCGALETVTKNTWLEKTIIFPLLLKITKQLLLFPLLRHLTRITAILLMPLLKAFNWVFEIIDKRAGISTTVLPKIFLSLKEGMYKKQTIRVQTARNR
jgi:radical SAM superfamily enzyme YgiQ (UPF0313 family)